jgi:hypothetical protein
MPRFRVDRLELMASFRSGCAAGQLRLFASAALSREVGHATGPGVPFEAATEGWKTSMIAAKQ